MDTLVSLSPYLLPLAFVAVSCLTTWSPQIKKALPFPEFLEDTLKEVSELFMLDILKPEVLKQDLVVVDSTTHAHVESERTPREIIELFNMAKGCIMDLASQLFMNVNTLVKSFTVVNSEMFYVSNNLSSSDGTGAINGGKLIRAEIMKTVREREKKMLENKESMECDITSATLDTSNENVEFMSEMEYLEFLEYVASCTSKDDTVVNEGNLGRTQLMKIVNEKEKKMVENKEGELWPPIPDVTDANVEHMSKMEYMEYLDYVYSCNVADSSVAKGRKLVQVELMESITEKKRGMTGHDLSPRTLYTNDENVESMSKSEYAEFLKYVASCNFDKLSSPEIQMADENVESMSKDEYSEFLEYVVSCGSDKNIIKGANSIQSELMETRTGKQKGMIENRVTKGGDVWFPTLQMIDENVEFMSEVEYLEYLEFVASCAI